MAELDECFVPEPRQMLVERAIMSGMRNSYTHRNPTDLDYMTRQSEAATGMSQFNNLCNEQAHGASIIIGDAGTGKSSIVKKILVNCAPQVIEHRIYKKDTLGITQVAWLYVSCPHDGSVKGLCVRIAHVLDAVVGGTRYLQHVQSQRTEQAMEICLGQCLALHAVGLIVVDEIQNICVGRQKNNCRLARFLVVFINSMSTRLMLVGTPEAQTELARDLPLLRRTAGESGQIRWAAHAYDEHWERFLKGIWTFQYTKIPTALSSQLSRELWELSAGIPDIAKRLYALAQMEIIGDPIHPDESLLPGIFARVRRTRLPFIDQLFLTREQSEFRQLWDKPATQAQAFNGTKGDGSSSVNPTSTVPPTIDPSLGAAASAPSAATPQKWPAPERFDLSSLVPGQV